MWSRRYLGREFCPTSIPSVFCFRLGYKTFPSVFLSLLGCIKLQMTSRKFDEFVICPNVK